MNSKNKERKLLFVYFIKIIQIAENTTVANLQNYTLRNYKLVILTDFGCISILRQISNCRKCSATERGHFTQGCVQKQT